MHLLIALAYLAFDLFRNANPLTIGIAVIFVLLAFRPRRRYRNRHRYWKNLLDFSRAFLLTDGKHLTVIASRHWSDDI